MKISTIKSYRHWLSLALLFNIHLIIEENELISVKVISLKIGRIIFKVTDFHGINQIKTSLNSLIYNYLTILLTHYWKDNLKVDSISVTKKYVYCEILGTGSLFSTKVKIDIDYGQEVGFWNQDRRLKDENGKSVKFNSMVDALNYMGTLGWEFVQAYVVTMPSMGGQQNV